MIFSRRLAQMIGDHCSLYNTFSHCNIISRLFSLTTHSHVKTRVLFVINYKYITMYNACNLSSNIDNNNSDNNDAVTQQIKLFLFALNRSNLDDTISWCNITFLC